MIKANLMTVKPKGTIKVSLFEFHNLFKTPKWAEHTSTKYFYLGVRL